MSKRNREELKSFLMHELRNPEKKAKTMDDICDLKFVLFYVHTMNFVDDIFYKQYENRLMKIEKNFLNKRRSFLL